MALQPTAVRPVAPLVRLKKANENQAHHRTDHECPGFSENFLFNEARQNSYRIETVRFRLGRLFSLNRLLDYAFEHFQGTGNCNQRLCRVPGNCPPHQIRM